jgi:zinc protease
MRVVIVHNPLAPVVTTEITYLAGSNEAPPGFPGTAHAVEHMMFRGSPGLSAAQLAHIGASLGGDFNAATQQTATQYFFTVPAAMLDVVLRIEATRMRGLLRSETLWQRERGAIEQEVSQDLSNPEYVFYQRLLQDLFTGTPYAHDALGTRPSFQRTTDAMLRAFHRTWYTPNNAVLVIVGDVELEPTLALVRRLFEPVPRRPLPARPAIQLAPLAPATIEMETDQPYGQAIVAYRLPGFDSPDFAAGQVLADVLDSQRGSLYGLVPQGKALSAGFDGTAFPKAAMGYASAGFPQGADGRALVAVIKEIIAEEVRTGVAPELIEAAKRHELADAEFRRNSVAGMAGEWSQAVAVEGRSSPDDDIEAIRRVTVEDVNRVARAYLVSETAIVGILTPRPSGKAVAARGFSRSQESFGSAESKPVPLPSWAQKVERVPGLPVLAGAPAESVLPNGLRLIVRPSSISRTVTLIGQVKENADLETPPGKEGVADLLGGLFNYGTETLDRLAFQAAQDAIAAEVSAGSGFALRVLAADWERGVELLADNLRHPALPEAAFETLKAQSVQAVGGELQSPGFRTRQAVRGALYPAGDPSLRHATPASLATLTLQDVKDYYHRVFRPDMTTIVVVGQVSPEAARAVIEKYFGDWTATGPKPETDLPPVPPNQPSVTAVPDPSRVQVEVTLAETLELTRSSPDAYTLRLANAILSGSLYASRLSRDLREKQGLVYSVDSLFRIGKTRSLFLVFYACDPANVSRARSLVEQELGAMQQSPVSASELAQAKTLLLRRIPLSEASLGAVAAQLLTLAVEERPLNEPAVAARHYLDLTAAEVQAAFVRWIRPQAFAQVTRGPEPR